MEKTAWGGVGKGGRTAKSAASGGKKPTWILPVYWCGGHCYKALSEAVGGGAKDLITWGGEN